MTRTPLSFVGDDGPAEKPALSWKDKRQQSFDPPARAAFGEEYLASEYLEVMSREIVHHYELDEAQGAVINFWWRRTKGSECAPGVHGSISMPKGLNRQVAEDVDYHLILNTEYLYGATWGQIEGTLLHLLMHIEEGDNGYMLKRHDFTGFTDELANFGAWTPALRATKEAVQLRLALGE